MKSDAAYSSRSAFRLPSLEAVVPIRPLPAHQVRVMVALNPKRDETTIAGYPNFPGNLLENLDIFKCK
jgi:hypothetical protein